MRALLVPWVLLLAGCLQAPGLLPASVPGPQADAPIPLAVNPWRDREADVAVNPLDPDHVAVFRNERPNPYVTGAVVTDPITPGILRQVLSVSRDAGATWTHSMLPYAGTAAPGSEWGQWCAQADPNVLFDREGVIHITTLGLSCGGPGLTTLSAVLHATTEDDGASWSEPATVMVGAAGPLAGLFNDREWTAYDSSTGTWAVVWTSLNLNRAALTVAFSQDGRSWSLPQELEVRPTAVNTANYLVHAVWLDEELHVTGFGCGAGPVDPACLVHFAGTGGTWRRSEIPIASCGLQAVTAGYASSAADPASGRLFVATPVFDAANEPAGVCVFASADGGATWPTARGFPQADHPWLAAAGRDVALAQIERAGDGWKPTVALLAPDLSPRWSLDLGPVVNMDTDEDGQLEYADYDGMAVGGNRFYWALTQPNQEGRSGGDAFDDLDIWVFHGSLG